MFGLGSDVRIYLSSGNTDMRKGAMGLFFLIQDQLNKNEHHRSLFVFRGKQADKIKIIWYDGQGFCLFYKCLERGKFMWPNSDSKGSIVITGAQLSMLLEGIFCRNPQWSAAPRMAG